MKLNKYLTKIQTKHKCNCCHREYVYKDELPLYTKLRKISEKGKKKQVIISEVVVVI